MSADGIDESAVGHRIDPRGHCRCGWELHDAAFRWSAELPTVPLPRSEVIVDGLRS